MIYTGIMYVFIGIMVIISMLFNLDSWLVIAAHLLFILIYCVIGYYWMLYEIRTWSSPDCD